MLDILWLLIAPVVLDKKTKAVTKKYDAEKAAADAEYEAEKAKYAEEDKKTRANNAKPVAEAEKQAKKEIAELNAQIMALDQLNVYAATMPPQVQNKESIEKMLKYLETGRADNIYEALQYLNERFASEKEYKEELAKIQTTYMNLNASSAARYDLKRDLDRRNLRDAMEPFRHDTNMSILKEIDRDINFSGDPEEIREKLEEVRDNIERG